jgi:hypothetical protein
MPESAVATDPILENQPSLETVTDRSASRWIRPCSAAPFESHKSGEAETRSNMADILVMASESKNTLESGVPTQMTSRSLTKTTQRTTSRSPRDRSRSRPVTAIGPASIEQTDLAAEQDTVVKQLAKEKKNSPRIARISRETCEWCRQTLGARNSSGRKRVYCSQSCRQRAYQSRKRSKQLGLKEGEVVVSSVLLDRMNKRLQALEVALVEVEAAELQNSDERVNQLYQAARRLRRLVVGPPTR